MQVQYEKQLLEESPLRIDDFRPTNANHQSLETYTLAKATLSPLEHIVASPSGNLLAVYIQDGNQIIMVDMKSRTRSERFSLKSCDKRFSKQSFALKAIDFSPDSTRLAVGQSDSIIYIYRLAQVTNQSDNIQTSSKPTITGKFLCTSPITCLLWCEFGIIFGTQDGKVKLISLSTKPSSESQPSSTTKVLSIFNSPKGLMPLSLAFKSSIVAVGFVDGTVHLISMSPETISNEQTLSNEATIRRNSSHTLTNSILHSCPPYYLAFMQANILCCAGSDGRIVLHSIKLTTSTTNKLESLTNKSLNVNWIQNIDLKDDIMAFDYSTINEILAIATTTHLLFIKCEQQETVDWRVQSSSIELANVFSISGLAWSKDGSQLFVGTLNGSLELFSCIWNKHSISEQLDICHIAKNRVRITDQARNLLAIYKTQYDIKKVNLLDTGQSIIIWTSGSLLLARLGQLQSEIPWSSREKLAKFSFENSDFVLIYNVSSRELLVVKLGVDSISYKVKLESISKSTISVRQHPTKSFIAQNLDSITQSDSKQSMRSKSSIISIDDSQLELDNVPNDNNGSIERLVYVMDSKSLIVVDLKSGNRVTSKQHNKTIKWLKLSFTGKNLIFIDSSNRLHLIVLDKESIESKLLLEECGFSNWVPDSDILVAQSAFEISIWYDIEEMKNAVILDSRSFNITNAPPLIDLSLTAKKSYPLITEILIDQLKLSNGIMIQLDKIKIRFFVLVVNTQLDHALEFLFKEDDIKKYLSLWTKLGWQSINHSKCDIAIKVFSKLGHKSMVSYMEKCIQKPEEKSWRLAMLRGDWDTFESLQETDQIISTYKRLNKWSRAIDYLTRTQQFRQRDIVEQEFKQWLINEKRYSEAAKLQAKAGDLIGALELLISNKNYQYCADLLIEEYKTSQALSRVGQQKIKLFDLCQTLKVNLIEQEQFVRAALICDKILGEANEALELYLKGKAFCEAKEIAKMIAADRVASIDEAFGEHLLQQYRVNRITRERAKQSIKHFLAASNKIKALEAAIEVRDYLNANEILDLIAKTNDNTVDLSGYSNSIGDFMLKKGNIREAIRAFEIGKQFKQVVELLISQQQFEAAFEVSLKSINDNDSDRTVKEFCELAKTKSTEEAEKIYLMIDKPELAIDMHREQGNFDKMVELINLFKPDQLESSLLLLAREFESKGDLESAESYLLKASESEWTNVVRMYRLAGKWEDAYRVARKHCSSERDPLLVQLAYWWSKSLPNNSNLAYDLLMQLNVFKLVIEFCCENKNFPFAIELCQVDGSNEALKRDIIKRFATFLEMQHRFDKAEEVLVQFGMVKEAMSMYLDNDKTEDAIRVIEQELTKAELSNEGAKSQLVDLLNETLIECARKISDEIVKPRNSKQIAVLKADRLSMDRLMAAQQMFLRAQRPELAVQLYKDRAMWQEAVQVAQRFAPQLIEDVERALDDEISKDLELSIEKPNLDANDSDFASKSSGKAVKKQLVGDFLREEAEFSMRSGDLKGTKRALGKFMSSLTEGNFQKEALIKQLDEKLVQLDQLVSDQKQLEKIFALADGVLEHFSWGKWNEVEERKVSSIWKRLRDSMAKMSLNEKYQDELDRRFLVAHYVTLFACLVDEFNEQSKTKQKRRNELKVDHSLSSAHLTVSKIERFRKSELYDDQLVSLLAKLSLSLLRYTDILGAEEAFHSAGLWLLLAGKRDLARFAWTCLIGLTEGASVSLDSDLKRAGAPALGELRLVGVANAVSAEQLAEVRTWLLESLIDSSGSSVLTSKQPLESCLVGQQPRPCLVCGYPVWAGAEEVGFGRFKVRASELKSLELMSSKIERRLALKETKLVLTNRKQEEQQVKLKLSEIIDFITSKLSSHDGASSNWQ